ncbi:6-bladed beta-propeller [uncultured Rikenella sp.]|uniref:6-bladed beta-propeller n=1 Tax=uncultured Rikenella sp. TaxID=368003 RepID=UPI00262865FA|nr:6-bladed beta-propeller [uncultured Rikenella sp.]
MKPFFFSLFGLILFACGSKPQQTASEQITIDFDAPEPTRKIEKVVPLETNSESLYGRFFRVRTTDTRIFVQDMQQILVFDANGKYLSKVDRVGHGPQEYITISHFWPYKDELYVVAGRSEKNSGLLFFRSIFEKYRRRFSGRRHSGHGRLYSLPVYV